MIPDAYDPRIFGFGIDTRGAQEIADLIARSTPQTVQMVVTPNLDHIINLRRNVAFAAAYRNASIVVCDGFPVRYYAASCGIKVQRVTGCDIITSLMLNTRIGDQRLFFMVDSGPTASAVQRWARDRQIDVQISVPPFGFENDETISARLIAKINDHATTILVMGVGAPKSEIWLNTYREVLPPCWALSIGQGVKVALGLTRRAPLSIQAMHMEWLWRVCQEPTRLWRRYLRGAILFPLAVIEDQLDRHLQSLAWRQAKPAIPTITAVPIERIAIREHEMA